MRSISKILIIAFFFVLNSISAQIASIPQGFSAGTLHYEEGFESGVPTGWTNLVLDQAKQGSINNGWVIDRDMSFTLNTGPSGAQSGVFYAYCDGSSPISRGATAIMTSELISLVGIDDPALLFYLNMHGQAGSFSVNIVEGATTVEVLPAVSADVPGGIHLPTVWEEVFIDLAPYAGKSIQIEFVTVKPNSGSNGDIAVDNIRIHSLALTVPTLGEWGIITLFLLLLIVAISTIKGFAAKGSAVS